MFNVLLKNESIWKPFVEFISDNSLLYEVYKCLVSFVEKSVTCIKDELWFLRTPRWIICQHKNHRHAQLSGWKRYFAKLTTFYLKYPEAKINQNLLLKQLLEKLEILNLFFQIKTKVCKLFWYIYNFFKYPTVDWLSKNLPHCVWNEFQIAITYTHSVFLLGVPAVNFTSMWVAILVTERIVERGLHFTWYPSIHSK